MVFNLRQTAIVAISYFCVACSASTEPTRQPTDIPIGPIEITESDEPSAWVPDIETIVQQIDPDCVVDGCIQSVEYFGAYDTVTLNEFIPLGVNIENGYSVWQVTYVTQQRHARATLTLPFNIEDPEGGYHVVLNNPPTVGFASRCASGSSVGAAALAAQFGAYGMVGVSVDYPGLGTEGSHPYLVAESEGKSALDGARAALDFLKMANVPVSNKIAIAGLSQGGHATLSAAAIHADYAPDLEIRAFAVAAPSNLFLEHWSPYINEDGYHLTFYALVTYAWSLYYGHSTENIFYEPRREEIETAIESLCLMEEDENEATLWDAVGITASEVFSSQFREKFESETLNDFPAIETGFQENRVRPFTQTAPIRIYQGTWDFTVPAESTQALIESLRNGGMDIQYEEIPLSGHLNTAFGYIATYQLAAASSRHWLRGQLDP